MTQGSGYRTYLANKTKKGEPGLLCEQGEGEGEQCGWDM